MELLINVTEAEIREAVGTYMRARMRDWSVGAVHLKIVAGDEKNSVTASASATMSTSGCKD